MTRPDIQLKREAPRASVLLVSLNVVRVPAIAPYALDVLGTALEDAGHQIFILDLGREDEPLLAIDRAFSEGQYDLVGLSMRNRFDLYFPSLTRLADGGSFLPSHQRLIDRIKQHCPVEQIVIGGVGFSTAPFGLLKRLGLKYGVRGPGEQILPALADCAARKRPLHQAPFPMEEQEGRGVFDGRRHPLQRKVRRTFVNNAWYYQYGGLGNLRATNGCAMKCGYCAEPYAKNAAFTNSAAEDVLFELDQMVEMGVRDIQTADSEFNMPLKHSKAILQAIAERGYPQDLRLWVYGQPSPWDGEYTELLARVGVPGVNLGTDHTDPEMLKALHKWYSPQDIIRTTQLCHANGIAVMHELLFGYPGDTPERMYRAIDFLRKLEPRVIGITIGMGVLEGTPLGELFARKLKNGEDLTGFYFEGEPFVDPVYYVDPSFQLPQVYEDLARFVGKDVDRIMIPKVGTPEDTDNQLVNSKRIEAQLLQQQKKGAYWYHYGT
jgi:radical SAM superfamily enzyme YgiQ (UPF0313 family)